MFTVKHIEEDGSESVFQAERVLYVPLNVKPPTPQMKEDVVYCYEKVNALASSITLSGGEVYVMNEAGKTIASYTMCSMPRQAETETK